jgi:hypothetical protein
MTPAVKRLAHRRGMLRVMAYGTAVGLVCAIVSVRAARAETIDEALVIGRQMTDLSHSAKTQALKVRMNGQEMMFATSLSHDAPAVILDRYEKLCRENAAQSPDDWKALAEKTPAQAKLAGETGGTIRGGSRDEGTIMCFVRSSHSKSTLGEALGAFQSTGELGAIGQLRYAYVRKTKNGNTSVLAAWTLDKFDLQEMLPDEGDAPGEDFAELPRPEGSRRLFSVKVVGTPYGLNVYESTNDPVKLANAYDERLTKDGWFALDIEGEGKRNIPRLDGVTGRVYERDGVLMTSASHIEDKKTITAFGVAGMPERHERAQR